MLLEPRDDSVGIIDVLVKYSIHSNKLLPKFYTPLQRAQRKVPHFAPFIWYSIINHDRLDRGKILSDSN